MILLLAAITAAGDLSGMVDAYLTAIAQSHWKERKAEIAALTTPEQIRARQQRVRQAMLRSLGGWPEKTPLEPQITGTLYRDGYRIEKVIFQSLPGFKVTANFYLPSTGNGPFPAVLGVAGHSNEGKAAEIYQRGWIGMVRRGIAVLAYDPPGQGERSEYWDAAQSRSRVGIGTREHTMAGLQCLLTGTSVARYEIWDGIRAFDYLLTRKEVDGARIAVAGNSGGGTQSAYLSALEPRLAAAAPSCYITSWETLWFDPGPQDAEQNFFGFIRDGLDFSDFLTAYAPRPVKMMTAIRDFFPIAGARATFAEAAGIFEKLGSREKVGFFEYDDTHGWSKPRREETYRWFEKWLLGREGDGLEAESTAEKPDALNVTATGQLATSGGSETVASLNRKHAERIYPRRTAALASSGGPAGIAPLVRRRLAVTMPAAEIHARKIGSSAGGEQLLIETEPGITVEAVLYTRPGATDTIVVLDPATKADPATVDSRANVCFLMVRGWGASAPPPTKRSGYGASYQTFMRAYLLGRTMAGMQTTDVLGAIAYLRSRGMARIRIHGHASGEALALYAGVLDPQIASVRRAGSMPSFLEITRMPQHEGLLEMIVPGVLADFDLPDLEKALGARYEK
ncbi:MAG: acetylxylan esterase [Bryobacteraceae bacterium]